MLDFWDQVEKPLPDVPNCTTCAYPASGAVAMLPLTPANVAVFQYLDIPSIGRLPVSRAETRGGLFASV
jgi:hypothetical protein